MKEMMQVTIVFGDYDADIFDDDQLKLIEELEGTHDILYFADYVALLEQVHDLTDGCYAVYNCGTAIECFS